MSSCEINNDGEKQHMCSFFASILAIGTTVPFCLPHLANTVVQVLEDAERLIAAWNERQAKPRVVSGVALPYNLRNQGAPHMGPAACCAGEDRDHAVGQPIRRLKEPDEFSVTVTRGNCAREIGMSAGKMKAGGVGATFDAAWDNVTGLPF